MVVKIEVDGDRQLLVCRSFTLWKKNALNEKIQFLCKYIYVIYRFRRLCIWVVDQKWFDNGVLLFIGLNCITLAMERPNIPPSSTERQFLCSANYLFTAVFAMEMFIKVF